MSVVTRGVGPPTVADARRAAEALVGSGAEEVLLFGSVARGDATDNSDIDLVALFADIDYETRWDLADRLREAGRDAVEGCWPVQVWVSDRPEWRSRLANVSASFETAISDEAVLVAESATRGRVRWDKPMVLPMSNAGEALKQFTDWVLHSLSSTRRQVRPASWETDLSIPVEERERDRRRRMVGLCASSLLTVDWALRSLAVLHGKRPPSGKALHGEKHSASTYLTLLPQAVRAEVSNVVAARGLRYEQLSQGGTFGCCPEDVAAARALADERAEDYRDTAVDVSALLVGALRAAVGDTPAMVEAEEDWHRIVEGIREVDLRSGQSRVDPPTPCLGVR